MTVVVWPSEAGEWMTAPDFTIAAPDGRMKSAPDVGPSKLRRRVSSAVAPVAGQMRCTLNQKARMERFWNEDTSGGVLPFVFPDQVYNNTILMTGEGEPILTEDDQVILIESHWLVQFAEPIQWRPIRGQGSWMAGISLNIMP